MASPFLNPLHSHLPSTPVAGPACAPDDAFKHFSLTGEDQTDFFGLDGANEKDDLATIASHLSLTSPKKKRRALSPSRYAALAHDDYQDAYQSTSNEFNHHLFARSLSAFASPDASMKRLKLSSSNLAVTFEEEEINTAAQDKIFSSCWLDNDMVVFGSKANKLTLYNTRHARSFAIETMGRPGSHTKMPRLGITNDDHDVCSGIYAIAKNPSGTLLASNGTSSCDATIYELPSMRPIRLIEAHRDAIFTMTWLDDERLMTGSRDGSIAIWDMSNDEQQVYACPENRTTVQFSSAPIVRRWRHQPPSLDLCSTEGGKVRSSQLDAGRRALATLGADGMLKLWDLTSLDVQRVVPLVNAQSAVALAFHPERQLYAVGSLLHTDFYDVRLPKPHCMSAESLDGDWGVRSLAFGSSNTVAVGGGLGRISFFDLRRGDYLQVNKADIVPHRPLPLKPRKVPRFGMFPEDEENEGDTVRCEIRTGRGWFRMDDVMMKQLSLRDVRHAAYTLAYDPSGTRLFAGGGPLELGLMGAYASVWL